MTMHKIIYEFKAGVKNLVVLTLDKQRPEGCFKKCRIDGKEYEINFVHFRGNSVEKMMDLMLRTIAIESTEVDSFMGKEVEFI